jgi:hypothetical protein
MPAASLPRPREQKENAPPVPQVAEQKAFQQGMQSMLGEWTSLSQRMAGLLENLATGGNPSVATSPNKPEPRQRIHTPLEGKTMERATKATIFKPEIRRGKLYFTCPACQHPTAVFKFYAGKPTRCPSCFSAIRTPDPKTGRKGHNLERDIDAFLHPERINAVLPRRRTITTFIPLPTMATAMAVVGAALILGTSSLSMFTANGSTEVATAASPAGARMGHDMDTHDLTGRAIETVEKFLGARGPVEKSAFVSDGARVARLMKQAFQESGEPHECHSMEVISSGLAPAKGANHFVTNLKATLPGGEIRDFIVEHLPHGDLIEWEASTGYNAHPWQDIAKRASEAGSEVAQIRALVRPDNYFNYRFGSEEDYYCLRLEDPTSGDLLGFGYASHQEAETLGLLAATMRADSENPERLTLEITFDEATAETGQARIVGLTQQGWRASGNTMLATVGDSEPQ